jgi:hypothetical protein
VNETIHEFLFSKGQYLERHELDKDWSRALQVRTILDMKVRVESYKSMTQPINKRVSVLPRRDTTK